jgi:hypothetical protein
MSNYLLSKNALDMAASDKLSYLAPKCKVLKMNTLHLLSNSVSDYTGGNTYNAKGFGCFDDEDEEEDENGVSKESQKPLDNNELVNY